MSLPASNVPFPSIVTVPVFLTEVVLSFLIPDKARAVLFSFTFKPVFPSTLRFIFKTPPTPKSEATLTMFPVPSVATLISLLIFTFVVPVISPTFTRFPVPTSSTFWLISTFVVPPTAPIFTRFPLSAT